MNGEQLRKRLQALEAARREYRECRSKGEDFDWEGFAVEFRATMSGMTDEQRAVCEARLSEQVAALERGAA